MCTEAKWVRDSYKRMMDCKLVTVTSLCLFCAIYGLYLYEIGKYAFGFHDPKNCYYIDGVDTPGTSRLDAEQKAMELQIAVKPGYPIDMAHLFRAWYIWGFWDKVFQLTIIAVFFPLIVCTVKNDRLVLVVFWVLQGIAWLSWLVWLILGFFWRFSHGGRVVSGEKLQRVSEGTSDQEWLIALEKSVLEDGY